MPSTPKASIIIVNWNGKHHLTECLDSLEQQSFSDFETIMVDNGSSDESVEFVKQHYSWVKVVPLSHNTGFAEGNNIGFENSRGKYIVTLNNDTIVDPKWLEHLIITADNHPDTGMVGCRITSYDDPDIIDSLGIKICLDGMSRGAYRNKRFSELAINGTIEILLPSACAALYRREMIEQIGFFDEDFFAYCEDTDLGLRGQLAGWKAMLNTEAIVCHKYSQTSGELSPFKVYQVERNHYWVAIKTLPLLQLMTLPVNTLFRFITQARILLFHQGEGAKFNHGHDKYALLMATFRGIVAAVLKTPRFLLKRREVQKTIKLDQQSVTRLFKKYRLSINELFDA